MIYLPSSADSSTAPTYFERVRKVKPIKGYEIKRDLMNKNLDHTDVRQNHVRSFSDLPGKIALSKRHPTLCLDSSSSTTTRLNALVLSQTRDALYKRNVLTISDLPSLRSSTEVRQFNRACSIRTSHADKQPHEHPEFNYYLDNINNIPSGIQVKKTENFLSGQGILKQNTLNTKRDALDGWILNESKKLTHSESCCIPRKHSVIREKIVRSHSSRPPRAEIHSTNVCRSRYAHAKCHPRNSYSKRSIAAATKIQSVIRVLLARSIVTRKLVSEVTAFMIVMERGISMTKHPFGSRAKSKQVTLQIFRHNGVFQVMWGSRSALPLSTVYGVVKGAETIAMQRGIQRNCTGPLGDRLSCCFSLLACDRTLDFEVVNPWLAQVIVRAMRLFLGAHYGTFIPIRICSPLYVIPRNYSTVKAERTGSISISTYINSIVWTANDVHSCRLPQAMPLDSELLRTVECPSLSPHSNCRERLPSNDETEIILNQNEYLTIPLPNVRNVDSRICTAGEQNIYRKSVSLSVSHEGSLRPSSQKEKGKTVCFEAFMKHKSKTIENFGKSKSESLDGIQQLYRCSNLNFSRLYTGQEDNSAKADEERIKIDLNEKLLSLRKMTGHPQLSFSDEKCVAGLVHQNKVMLQESVRTSRKWDSKESSLMSSNSITTSKRQLSRNQHTPSFIRRSYSNDAYTKENSLRQQRKDELLITCSAVCQRRPKGFGFEQRSHSEQISMFSRSETS